LQIAAKKLLGLAACTPIETSPECMLALQGLTKNKSCTIFQQQKLHTVPFVRICAACSILLSTCARAMADWLACKLLLPALAFSRCRPSRAQSLKRQEQGERCSRVFFFFETDARLSFHFTNCVCVRAKDPRNGRTICVVSAPARFSSLTLLISAERQRSTATIHRSRSIIPLNAKFFFAH
jgi:hypothetical protein